MAFIQATHSKYIKARAVKIGKFIVENKSTIRDTAKEFGVAHGTVANDCNRLEDIDLDLHTQVRSVLVTNWDQKSSRGGIARVAKLRKGEAAKWQS